MFDRLPQLQKDMLTKYMWVTGKERATFIHVDFNLIVITER
jgi:hypothetical protein